MRLAARGLRTEARGFDLDDTEADFLTVATEEEIELERECDLEVLL